MGLRDERAAKWAAKQARKGSEDSFLGSLFTKRTPTSGRPGYEGKVNGMGPRGGAGSRVTGDAGRRGTMTAAEERRLIKESDARERQARVAENNRKAEEKRQAAIAKANRGKPIPRGGKG